MSCEKVNNDFVQETFRNYDLVLFYKELARDAGLWNSERIIITRYFKTDDTILDIGCGTGRTTLGMYRLGYKNVKGIDLSPDMIKSAISLARELNTNISYAVSDACEIKYEDEFFDGILFSFNGLVHIPGEINRLAAFKDIRRVLKRGGYFVFTAIDRGKKEYNEFWQNEEVVWTNGMQDRRLIDFGDRFVQYRGKEIFLHFYTIDEIIKRLNEVGFRVIEHKNRSEISIEQEKVKSFSEECTFWIAQKI